MSRLWLFSSPQARTQSRYPRHLETLIAYPKTTPGSGGSLPTVMSTPYRRFARRSMRPIASFTSSGVMRR